MRRRDFFKALAGGFVGFVGFLQGREVAKAAPAGEVGGWAQEKGETVVMGLNPVTYTRWADTKIVTSAPLTEDRLPDLQRLIHADIQRALAVDAGLLEGGFPKKTVHIGSPTDLNLYQPDFSTPWGDFEVKTSPRCPEGMLYAVTDDTFQKYLKWDQSHPNCKQHAPIINIKAK